MGKVSSASEQVLTGGLGKAVLTPRKTSLNLDVLKKSGAVIWTSRQKF
jgi:hypothetical protein